MFHDEGMYPLMLPNIRGHFAISEMTAGNRCGADGVRRERALGGPAGLNVAAARRSAIVFCERFGEFVRRSPQKIDLAREIGAARAHH